VVIEKWNWKTAWGWDFPLSALCATVLDEPEKAIDLLMMDTYKNKYLLNGHNYQDDRLPLYLPGNGGLLSAVAFLCTYRNEKGENGFPSNGKWKVKYENFPPGIE
jgi:protein-glucosylgalactosylhydroxylysine glucosidase